MIGDVFGLLARAFPVLVAVLCLAAGYLLLRAWSKTSSGSIGTGAARIPPPAFLSYQALPWDLVNVDEALQRNSPEPLELLIRRAEGLGIALDLPANVPARVAVEVALDQLEAHLGLGPIDAFAAAGADLAPDAHPNSTSTSTSTQQESWYA